MIATFRAQKRLAERAIEQLTDDQLRIALDANTNSIAVIVKHLSGNMVSRWTDLLSSDGEKPGRDRDDEFIDTFQSRDQITQCWEAGWQCLFDSLASLSDQDLTGTVTIRGEPSTVLWAILRQVSHYGNHVAQIVLIARVLAKDHWQTITIPKGGSRKFNEQMSRKPAP